jgi:hypothetical protein
VLFGGRRLGSRKLPPRALRRSVVGGRRADHLTHDTDVIMREMGSKKRQGRPGRMPRRRSPGNGAHVGFYVASGEDRALAVTRDAYPAKRAGDAFRSRKVLLMQDVITCSATKRIRPGKSPSRACRLA